MPTLERILVCLERVERDARLIEWAAGIASATGDADVIFVHVQTTGGVPADIATEHPDLLESPASIEAAIREVVDRHFRGPQRTTVRVIEQSGGLPFDILQAARDADADLVLTGRAPASSPETGLLASAVDRLVRKAHCSVLVVPADRPAAVREILVPFRNSDCSARALEQAVDLARAFHAGIVCANVYHVHSGYARIGMTYDEFAAVLESHARTEYDTFVGRVDVAGVNIRGVFVADPGNDPARQFNQVARDERADLVVIGARGRSGAAGVLLGHVTETLIQTSRVPVLAVKKKGETIGLLDALMTIAG